MSKVVSANFTSPVASSYHSQDTDVYDRNDSFTAFLQDLDVHDGRTGKGLGIGRITSTAIAATANTGECVTETGGLKITDGTTQNDLFDCKQNGYTAYKCIGLTGATAASRYVGATTTGAPGSGTFAVGDFIATQDGNMFICTAAGTPGTWRKIGIQPGTTTGYTAGTTDPSGGLLADGRAISRTTFATAFAVSGTAFGTGDGSTTYNIPDKRSRVWMGADNMGTSAGAASRASGSVALGNTSGADTHTLTTSELPHLSYTVGNATATYQEANGASGSGTLPAGGYGSSGGSFTGTTNSFTITVSDSNGGGSMSLRQLTQIVNEVYWT